MGIQDRDWYWEDRDRKEKLYGDGSTPPIRNNPAPPTRTTGVSPMQNDTLKAIGSALLKVICMIVIVFAIVAAFWLFVAFAGIRF